MGLTWGIFLLFAATALACDKTPRKPKLLKKPMCKAFFEEPPCCKETRKLWEAAEKEGKETKYPKCTVYGLYDVTKPEIIETGICKHIIRRPYGPDGITFTKEAPMKCCRETWRKWELARELAEDERWWRIEYPKCDRMGLFDLPMAEGIENGTCKDKGDRPCCKANRRRWMETGDERPRNYAECDDQGHFAVAEPEVLTTGICKRNKELPCCRLARGLWNNKIYLKLVYGGKYPKCTEKGLVEQGWRP